MALVFVFETTNDTSVSPETVQNEKTEFELRIWITKFLDEPSWGEIFEFSEFFELFENLSSILSCKKTGFYATCLGHINVKNHKNLR